MLKILISLCCAWALHSQPSTFTPPCAKWPTQHRASSECQPRGFHYLPGEAFHLLISTRAKEFLALIRYGIHTTTAQQWLRPNCRHSPPSSRCSHALLTKTSSAASSAYSPRVCPPITCALLWCTNSDSNETTFPPGKLFPHLLQPQVCFNGVFAAVGAMCDWMETFWPNVLKKSGTIWQYFSTATCKLPLKHFAMLWGTSQLGTKIVDKTFTHHHTKVSCQSKWRKDLWCISEAFIQSLGDGWE